MGKDQDQTTQTQTQTDRQTDTRTNPLCIRTKVLYIRTKEVRIRVNPLCILTKPRCILSKPSRMLTKPHPVGGGRVGAPRIWAGGGGRSGERDLSLTEHDLLVVVIYCHLKNLVWVTLRDYVISRSNLLFSTIKQGKIGEAKYFLRDQND